LAAAGFGPIRRALRIFAAAASAPRTARAHPVAADPTKEKYPMSSIKRLETGPRMSQAVIHGGLVYLAGQVGAPGKGVAEQTRAVLARIDELLAAAGSDKTRILQATIWLADIGDFAAMNSVWDAWVAPGHAPARATGESALATPDYKVEIIIVAAAG